MKIYKTNKGLAEFRRILEGDYLEFFKKNIPDFHRKFIRHNNASVEVHYENRLFEKLKFELCNRESCEYDKPFSTAEIRLDIEQEIVESSGVIKVRASDALIFQIRLCPEVRIYSYGSNGLLICPFIPNNTIYDWSIVANLFKLVIELLGEIFSIDGEIYFEIFISSTEKNSTYRIINFKTLEKVLLDLGFEYGKNVDNENFDYRLMKYYEKVKSVQ